MRAPAVTVAVLAALLAGCGTAAGTPSATPVAAAATPDPCTLLHDDEVAALLRDSVTRSGPEARSRGTICSWETTAGNLLSVQVYRGRTFFAPDVQAPTGHRIADVGDEAYVDDGVAGALAGEIVVVVDAVGPGTHGAVEDALRGAVARVRT